MLTTLSELLALGIINIRELHYLCPLNNNPRSSQSLLFKKWNKYFCMICTSLRRFCYTLWSVFTQVKKMLLLPSSVCRRLQYNIPPHLVPKVRLKISLKQCVLSVLHKALAAEMGRDGWIGGDRSTTIILLPVFWRMLINTQCMQQNLLGIAVGCALKLKMVYGQLPIGMVIPSKFNAVKQTIYGS